MNAAAAVAAGDLAEDLPSGAAVAEESIASGAGLAALEKLVEVSNS